MRRAFLYILALVLATSCSVDIVDSSRMGSISLSLSSDVEVVATSKADAGEYSDFLVDIYGTRYHDGSSYASQQYTYGNMPESVTIPFGHYRVSAQSCTEALAESANDGHGKVRYHGESSVVEVLSYDPVPVAVACKMANGKTVMTFDQSFLDDFTDITVAFTVGERTVTLTSEQANAGTEVYFNLPAEGADLTFNIQATVAEGTEQERVLHYSNAETPTRLLPGKCANYTIKSNHNGIIGGPDIDVDDTMDDETITEIIDPDEGKDSGEISISIQVDTQIDDATVVDCIIDII